MIDLHLHSIFSDGTDTPEALVARGRAAGLRAMALTDHDSLAGVEAFLAACRAQGMTGLSGVELSAEPMGGQTLHLLGYGVNPRDASLDAALREARAGRDARNRRMMERLHELGLPLEWRETQMFAGQEMVGRSHLARALAARGHVATVAEAFDRYLARGRPAYVERARLSARRIIELAREAGGIVTLAHPFSWHQDEARLDQGLAALAAEGLAGLEAYYSEYDPGQTVTLLRLAARHKLLATGGSDDHGAGKPAAAALGRRLGALDVPDACLPPLLERLGRDHPWAQVAADSPWG